MRHPGKAIPCALAAYMTAGCASVSPIAPSGPDTYVISKTSGTALATGRQMIADVSNEANAFCAQQGKRLIPLETTANDGVLFIDFARARMRFRCGPAAGQGVVQ